MRTRTSFQKRQKEIARAEKQRDKIAKRQQKKLIPKKTGEEPDELNNPPDSNSETGPTPDQ